jgi:hypothetical protein
MCVHPSPFLFVSGHLWHTAEGITGTIARRKFDVDLQQNEVAGVEFHVVHLSAAVLSGGGCAQFSLTTSECGAVLRSLVGALRALLRLRHCPRRSFSTTHRPQSEPRVCTPCAQCNEIADGGQDRRCSATLVPGQASADRQRRSLRRLRSRTLATLRGNTGDPEIVAHSACTT